MKTSCHVSPCARGDHPIPENGEVTANPERIRVFITGGTFDKEYDEINGRLYFKDSHLPEMLKLGRCNIDIAVRPLMMIDSAVAARNAVRLGWQPVLNAVAFSLG